MKVKIALKVCLGVSSREGGKGEDESFVSELQPRDEDRENAQTRSNHTKPPA